MRPHGEDSSVVPGCSHDPLQIRIVVHVVNFLVAGPGFSRGHHPQSGGANLLIWQTVCRKLHGSKRNWTERRACVPRTPPMLLDCMSPFFMKGFCN